MNRALPLALALACVAGDALAVTARWQRHWRRESHVPPNPHPELLHPVYPAPAPSGFVMDVVKTGAATDANETIRRPRDVAERLAACWTPPDGDGRREITLRLQFAASGKTIGEPRISYVNAANGSRDALASSIRGALAACLPLRFTGSLGAAIAGYPFAIRFIATGVERQINTGDQNGGSR